MAANTYCMKIYLREHEECPLFSPILFLWSYRVLEILCIPASQRLILKPLTISQTTNFRLFPTERVCRQFQIQRKQQKILKKGRKHCGKRQNHLLQGGKYSKMVGNTVAKGQIACCMEFLLFQQHFQKTFTEDR